MEPKVLRRVQCNNPHIIKNFHKLYKYFLIKHNLFNRIYTMQQCIENNQYNNEAITEYEIIRKLRLERILEVD